MNNLQITGLARAEILKAITRAYPEWQRPENKVRQLVGPRTKREVHLEQGAAIAYLASQYDHDGARILEIGACQGYSAGILKLAAPLAKVTTLEPHQGRAAAVRNAVGQPLGITVLEQTSIDFMSALLSNPDGEPFGYDLIFVDGDHANVALDLPLYNLLLTDGLFLHHDYSPEGSARECIPVFDALNHFNEQMQRAGPDVLVQDDTLVAMAGWYKRDGEVWPPDGQEVGEDGYVVDTEPPAGQQQHEFASDKGVICRHCLKTEDDGDHLATGGIVPLAFEVGDGCASGSTAAGLSDAQTGDAASAAEKTAKPKRRTRRNRKSSSSDDA